jgi:hypothetical protein
MSNLSARDIASSQELLWAQSTLALCYKPDDIEYMMEAAVRVCLSGIMTFPEAVWAVCVPVLRTRKGMDLCLAEAVAAALRG